jgi:hypothetical protein
MDPQVRPVVAAMVLAMAKDAVSSGPPVHAAVAGPEMAPTDPADLSAEAGLLGQAEARTAVAGAKAGGGLSPAADRSSLAGKTAASPVVTPAESVERLAVAEREVREDVDSDVTPNPPAQRTAGALLPTPAERPTEKACPAGAEPASAVAIATADPTTVPAGAIQARGANRVRPAEPSEPTPAEDSVGHPSAARPARCNLTTAENAGSESHGGEAAARDILDESSHWRKQLRQTVTRLRQDLQSHPPEDQRELARQQMYLSLLHLVAEDRDEAMEVLQDIGDEELEFWRQTVMGLGVLLDPDEMPRFRQRVDSATHHLRQGISSLSTLGPLRLNNLALCSKVNGFGDFEEFRSYAFRPGQPVILYVEVENFDVEQYNPAGPDVQRNARRRTQYETHTLVFQTELHGRWEILDAQQRPVASRVLPVDRNQCRNRRHDYFIPYTLYMPEQIAAGFYTLELTIEDKNGGKFGHGVVDFQIQ